MIIQMLGGVHLREGLRMHACLHSRIYWHIDNSVFQDLCIHVPAHQTSGQPRRQRHREGECGNSQWYSGHVVHTT